MHMYLTHMHLYEPTQVDDGMPICTCTLRTCTYTNPRRLMMACLYAHVPYLRTCTYTNLRRLMMASLYAPVSAPVAMLLTSTRTMRALMGLRSSRSTKTRLKKKTHLVLPMATAMHILGRCSLLRRLPLAAVRFSLPSASSTARVIACSQQSAMASGRRQRDRRRPIAGGGTRAMGICAHRHAMRRPIAGGGTRA